MRYRYVRLRPDHLAGGRPLAFGDVVNLSRREAGRNARLLAEGALVRLQTPRKPSRQEDAS